MSPFFGDTDNRERIFGIVAAGLKVALSLEGVEGLAGRSGIHFRLTDIFAETWLAGPVGQIPPEKWDTYSFNSEEKAYRLTQNPEHRGSSESADRTKTFAGAILDDLGTIWSCSGLPQDVDEALMLACAVKAGRLSEKNALALAVRFENRLYGKIMDAWSAYEATL